MDAEATPRVNFEAMQRFHGRRVALIAQIKSSQPGAVVVSTSDDAEVTIRSNTSNATAWDSQFVEVIGTVIDSRTIQEEMHTNLGNNFDMRLYNEMVRLSTGKYASMFI